MGRVWDSLEVGDIIVFSRAKVPHLLQKWGDRIEDDEGERYFLVGECCKLCQPSISKTKTDLKDIHELMEGEAFQELEKGERSLQTFTLM